MTTFNAEKLDDHKALFRSIADNLRHEIRGGGYQIGDRIPPEIELCEQFKASRHTIRAALNCLQEEGLIRRRQGAGTVVIATESDGRFHNSISSLNELVQFATNTDLEILSIDVVIPTGVRAQLIGIDVDKPWTRILALRKEKLGALAIGYSEIYIPTRFSGITNSIGNSDKAIYELIEEKYGIEVTEVNQVIEAEYSDADLASRLSLKKGSPILLISRHYYDSKGDLVEVALNAHPRNRFKYEMTLKLNQP
jgi:DNA-binding GntR family transcriptional regulator